MHTAAAAAVLLLYCCFTAALLLLYRKCPAAGKHGPDAAERCVQAAVKQQ